MKKLLISILALILVCPAYAEVDMMLPLGPYTFDAADCLSFNYESESAMYVDYSWGYMSFEYIEFSDDWTTPEYFEKYHGAHNSWEIAKACIDIWYAESNPIYINTEIEDTNLQYFPACQLFTCTVSDEYGGGKMPCAIFADENGILFAECVPYVSDDQLVEVRAYVLQNLFFNYKSVISPEAAAEAYAAREVDTKPSIIEFGDDFTYDAAGCTNYTKTGDDFVSIVYDDYIVSIEYFTVNDIIYLPEELDRVASAEDPNAQRAKICYTNYVVGTGSYKDLKLESVSSDSEKGILLFNSRYGDDNYYVAGAVCANNYGTLFIDVYHAYEEGWLENIQQIRESALENISCIILE